jgi:DNA-binding NtrC family response regulator
VVDDEVDTCRNLSDILTDLGYRVDTAYDGYAALELVKKHQYDVALLDLKMPGMDGLELYREIKKLQSGTVAMVVTAYASSATAEEALTAGACQVLSKPVDFPRLLALVDQALGQPLVMVIDDDHDLCLNLWDLLHERGYRVSISHGEQEAANLLRERSYKVVLIDMKLPRGDGASMFQLVRETNPEARTIVITGHRSEMDLLVQKGRHRRRRRGVLQAVRRTPAARHAPAPGAGTPGQRRFHESLNRVSAWRRPLRCTC